MMEVVVDPAEAGTNDIHLSFYDHAGKPVTGMRSRSTPPRKHVRPGRARAGGLQLVDGVPRHHRAHREADRRRRLRRAGPTVEHQAQSPRPSTQVYVFDDNTDTDGPGGGEVATDFCRMTRLTWDGNYVQDAESFGNGCPTTTPGIGDTGRTHFVGASDGGRTSSFALPRTEPGAYCTVHQGNIVPAGDPTCPSNPGTWAVST